MTTLKHLELSILEVEGFQAALSGNAPVIYEYWKTKSKADDTVTAYKARFTKRYPGIDIELYDGIGQPAHGNYLLKNLRATYEFAWVKKEYEDMYRSWEDVCLSQARKIQALKKALRASSKSTVVEEDDFNPYEVLKVPPDASDEEITQAYKKMIQVIHPDRLDMMPPLIKELANEKAKEVNRARDMISQQRSAAKAA